LPPALAPGLPVSVDDLLAGQPYRKLRRLGGGGMSVVYLVEHELLLKRFALKVLHAFHAERRDLADRARLEAQAIARLRHPNVVDVVDFWFGPHDTPCIVLELLEGATLAKELEQAGRLPPVTAIGFARQALSALQAAHEIGIVHRDVKPENLFVIRVPGQADVIKVLDFGLARVLPQAPPAAPAPPVVPTGTGVVVGTLLYMSPEQSRGEKVGPLADVFSLGLVLYTMLTGRRVQAAEIARAEPPSRVVELGRFAGVDAVITRALAPEPAARWASAGEFRRELKRVLL
jgi:serine/threonine protein kinase